MNAPQTKDRRRPLQLVLSGEACRHTEILRTLLGPHRVDMVTADSLTDLVGMVETGRGDAVVIDSNRSDQELLVMLRSIRRVTWALPVVLVVRRATRRFMEGALRLDAFSVVHKPLEREELLVQLRRIVERLNLDE